MMNKDFFSKLKNILKTDSKVYVGVHDTPDGDALGSAVAVIKLLEKMGKRVWFIVPSNISEKYKFLLSMIDNCSISYDVVEIGGILIMLDIASWEQSSRLYRIKSRFNKIVNIDHHIDNKNFGDINWIDKNASAVGEMIYSLFDKMGIEYNRDVATALYAAIVTDTGSFKFSNTTPETHITVSKLLRLGADTRSVIGNVYENIPVEKYMLLAGSLKTLKLSDDKKIAWMWVTQDEGSIKNNNNQETEGFIDFLKNIKGVEIAIMFKKAEDNIIRVTFRSKDGILKVNEIAAIYGGGGHPAAAGCSIKGSKSEVEKQVISSVKEYMRQM